MSYKEELLAPVGSMESLYAAIENGADAVYLGGKLFNARHFASNFDLDELKEVIKYSHINNVKVYITINTLIKNEEMEEVLDYIRFLYEEDADAIIVQDLGLARNVRKLFPDLDIHASTQMTVNNLEGVKLLEEIGFKRVVLARETPLDEIKRIREGSSIELEGFIHGALCVSYSGQCLMSSLIGGRSGNRGKCAQPCRMPYTLVDESGETVKGFEKLHLLSPKDLNTLDHIESLKKAGISSFKVEGRMKRPEYVATIVNVYRGIIDGKKGPTRAQRDDVEQIFNRGFTKGVGLGDFGRDFISQDRPDNRGTYLGKIVDIGRDYVTIYLEKDLSLGDGIEFVLESGKYKGMESPTEGRKGEIVRTKRIGNIRKDSKVYKSSSIDLLKRAQASYKEETLYPVDMEVYVEVGEHPILILKQEDYKIRVESDFITDQAKNRPLTTETIEEQISRLGNTQFKLGDLKVELGEDCFLPLSVLNKLRRDATDILNGYLENKNNRKKFTEEEFNSRKNKILNISKFPDSKGKKLSVKLDKLSQFEGLDLSKLDILYLPLVDGVGEKVTEASKKGVEVYISTPKILYEEGFKKLGEKLEPIKDIIGGVSVNNLGSLQYIKSNYNLKLHAGIGLNIFNSYTVDFLRGLEVYNMTLSQELTLSEISSIEKLVGGELETVVYGYLPVMTTRTCPIASLKACKDDRDCETCKFMDGYALNDRMNKNFYMSRKKGYTTIYNSVPVVVLDSLDQIYNSGIGIARLDFTGRKENIGSIQEAYHNVLSKEWNEREARSFVDKMRDTTEITKGHFFRGVV